jgi:hypothetical protein
VPLTLSTDRFERIQEYLAPHRSRCEPEAAPHPAAASLLFEALHHATENTQLIVTNHSPDWLDNQDEADNHLLAVTAESGLGILGPMEWGWIPERGGRAMPSRRSPPMPARTGSALR